MQNRETDAEQCLLAVPKKGRLFERINELLKGIGIRYRRENRLDVAICKDLNLKLVFLPAKDIATFVGEGNIDMGLTGQDMIAESNVDVEELVKTGFGSCKLALLAPTKDGIKDPKELLGKRIATSFPHLTTQYFNKLDAATGPSTKIRNISGSVEAACGLGLADAVVDLWETGTTAKAAGLGIVDILMETECVFLANKHSEHKEMIQLIRQRIEGYLLAKQNAMMYFNVEKAKLDKATEIAPGKKKPTVSPLSDPEWVSVGAMVAMKQVNNIMDQLQQLGATDIFIVDIVNCRS